ncbi:Mrp/NBP35 family ATP-binding protein [Candidatus Bipolaricaulota sp. J31]
MSEPTKTPQKERREYASRTVMVLSGKGGVGKSTVAVNLAVALGEKLSVGVLDADLHGPNVPKLLGVEHVRPEVHEGRLCPVETPHRVKVVSMGFLLPRRDSPLIWRGPLKMKALHQLFDQVEWGKLDLLVVDLPPGTGDEPLSVAQILGGTDGAVIVTTPQELARLDAAKAISFARKVGARRIGVVENMSYLVCPHCGKEIDLFGKGGGEKLAAEAGVDFLGRLPLVPAVIGAGDKGVPAASLEGVKEPFIELALSVWDWLNG